MANPIAKEMAEDYGISPRNSASILDTFSCVFQGVIPYGAQMLVAISAATELGCEISAFDIMPNLYYPFMLLIEAHSSLCFIHRRKPNKKCATFCTIKNWRRKTCSPVFLLHFLLFSLPVSCLILLPGLLQLSYLITSSKFPFKIFSRR